MGTDFTQVLDSLGWAVLHSIWQGVVALLIVLIWRAALRGRSLRCAMPVKLRPFWGV